MILKIGKIEGNLKDCWKYFSDRIKKGYEIYLEIKSRPARLVWDIGNGWPIEIGRHSGNSEY